MNLKNNFCSVRLAVNRDVYFGNLKDYGYDVILNPEGYTDGDDIKVFEFNVTLFSQQKKIALVVHLGESEGENTLLEETSLIVLLDDIIMQINLVKGSIVNEKPTDMIGSVFALKKHKNDYIVHCETEIARFDSRLNKLWSFSGKDIFVSLTDNKAFEMGETSIKLCDFEDNFYEIDYNGRSIR